ncbi:MAG TPA: hypothetical protein VLJ41_03975, partial [Segetibacter sp.]|nr:hypothetical protein [Segetibacter sp.]
MKKSTIKNSFCGLLIALTAFLVSGFKTPARERIDQTKTTRTVAENEDFEKLRKRIVDDLLEPAVDGNKITKIIATIKPDGSWPGINYKDTTKTGFEHRIHLENMLDLARAYRKQGSQFSNNADVKKTLWSALDFWIAHDFICENWWWNEMGTPNLMINTLLLMDADLTEKQKTEGARIAGRASLKG